MPPPVCRYCAAMLTPCLETMSLSLPITPGTSPWMWMMRVPEGRGGSCTPGKLTAPSVEPTSEYSTSLRVTSAPMRSCASSVEPPMCGVRITLGRPCSGVTSLSLLEAGSTGNTSIAAPASLPARIAVASASRSTTWPRLLLIRQASSLISAISRAPIMPAVCGVSGTCSETTSLKASNSSRLPVGSVLPWRSRSVRSKKMVRMPIDSARLESCEPILP